MFTYMLQRSSQVDHHSDGGLSDGDLEERDLKVYREIFQFVILRECSYSKTSHYKARFEFVKYSVTGHKCYTA